VRESAITERRTFPERVAAQVFIQFTLVYLLGLLSRFSHVTRLLFSYISSLLKMTDNGANAIIFRAIQNHCASECERAE
jgi:hypothetical protein